jgi:hypothetical protein
VLLALAAAGPERPRLLALDRIANRWVDVVRDFGESDISALYLTSQGR